MSENTDYEKEMFSEWMAHPVTKHLRKWAQNKRKRLKDAWESGQFTASFEAEMISRNAAATGACSVYKEIEEMDFDEVFSEESNEK